MVSTSIGEEGLDIGEVDLIVCYDSQNSPIRMLQRMGRTGRKRKGRVVLLLTQGKEEESYKRAQSQYKSVQVCECYKAYFSRTRFVIIKAQRSKCIPVHMMYYLVGLNQSA